MSISEEKQRKNTEIRPRKIPNKGTTSYTPGTLQISPRPWPERVTLLDSSSCVPRFQASEKMELTMLWERTCPAGWVSDTPLSDWLEWLDWDSVWNRFSKIRLNKSVLWRMNMYVWITFTQDQMRCRTAASYFYLTHFTQTQPVFSIRKLLLS